MESRALVRLLITSTFLLYAVIDASPLPQFSNPNQDGSKSETADTNNNSTRAISPQNGTIADIVQRQTDTIKQIVSNQHQQYSLQQPANYPVVTKYPSAPKDQAESHKGKETIARENIDKMTLEELKTRCQHLSELAATKVGHKKGLPELPQYGNEEGNPIHKYRVGIRRPIGFYITTVEEPSTAKPTTTTTVKTTPEPPPSPPPLKPSPVPQTPQNVKLIKLEPVILQKTILSDGRIIYYWHKSLPSAVQFGPPVPATVPSPEPSTTPSTTSTSTTTTTTTTTAAPSAYDFRNFFPSFYSSGGAEQQDTTTTEKATAASGSTSGTTTTARPEELQFAQQLKFVVPVPYANAGSVEEENVRKPWDFDQFAYYPKPLQPETVKVQMPYVPTFHIIKALAIPNSHNNDMLIDDVNIA